MFLAQHHSYLGDPDKALSLIERALEHTPTLIELYIVKGKILKVRLKIFGVFSENTYACPIL